MTTDDFMQKTGVARTTITRWASKNKVKYVGEGRRKTYIFTEDDYSRFLKRPKPGKRAKKTE